MWDQDKINLFHKKIYISNIKYLWDNNHEGNFKNYVEKSLCLTCNSSRLEVLCNKKEENYNQTLIIG